MLIHLGEYLKTICNSVSKKSPLGSVTSFGYNEFIDIK